MKLSSRLSVAGLRQFWVADKVASRRGAVFLAPLWLTPGGRHVETRELEVSHVSRDVTLLLA